jgi:hypothetical protein
MLATRSILIWSIVAAVCLIIVLLRAGRQISIFLDQFITLRLKTLPVSPLEYQGASLRIGDVSLPLIRTDNVNFYLTACTDSQNRLVISHGGQSFTFGPRLTPPDPRGRSEIKFASEPGDEITLEFRRSVITRPTPFEFNFLMQTPWWRRYLYYHLEWKKPSGTKLDMLWRYEQQYYSGKGWNEGYMMYDFSTGLVHGTISSETISQESVVVQYLARTKGWKRTEYRIESQGRSADGKSDVLAIIHSNDECCPTPGAGQSVVLYVDRATHQVTQELGGQ